MRFWALTVVVASSALAAEPPNTPCGQRLITASNGPGDLTLSIRKSDEGEVEHWLHFTGPQESETGRTWPIGAKLAGKFLTVTIGKKSVPSAAGGETLPAEGTNSGSVKLPKLKVGKYELFVRQHNLATRYALEVKEGEWSLRSLQNTRGLWLAAMQWRQVGTASLATVQCSGTEAACEAAFAADLIQSARLEDGGWLDARWPAGVCVVRVPPAGFPALPEGSILAVTPLP